MEGHALQSVFWAVFRSYALQPYQIPSLYDEVLYSERETITFSISSPMGGHVCGGLSVREISHLGWTQQRGQDITDASVKEEVLIVKQII